MKKDETSNGWRERLTSPLTWHVVGFSVLLALAIVLGVRLAMDWTAMDSHANDVLAGKQVELRALDYQTAPLRGLDGRVAKTREQLAAFEQKRIPPTYSSIDARLNELEVTSGVRLSREQYTQSPTGTGLTEISIEAGISGDYPAIMKFINSIERDQTFFIIRTMSFTGAQGGLVNLRLVVSTWLRSADAAASGLPTTPQPDNSPSTPNKEGE
jgi:type IV pilus assembly protein PilO